LYAILLSPIRAIWPSHAILHMITPITSGGMHRSLSSSLSSFLHSLVTSPLLVPNIFSQHPILINSLPTFLLQCERPSFTPLQEIRQNLYFCVS
jgi:hypothetical protein